MVRKVGFGDDRTETDSGQVRRGEPPRKTAKPRLAVEQTARAEPDPKPEAEAPETATPEAPATPAAAVPVSGNPRWGAIFLLLILLSTWLAMSGLVVAGMVQRKGDGVPVAHLLWIALSLYGTIVLLRKLRHMYRGGSWLQTPADAARKSGGGDPA